MHWKLATVVVCSYGFWKELRPVTPFLTPYLVSDAKNFTDVELYSRVYPFWTYSYLLVLIPVFILTDLLRYKPVMICEGLAYVGTWFLLIWGRSIVAMQCMQVLYGIATATEVAYYAYIYAVIDEKHYQTATSYVRGAVLAGRCAAYTLGQVLISTGLSDYMHLNYISMASVCLILVIAIFLPQVNSTIILAAAPSTAETAEMLDNNNQISAGAAQSRHFTKTYVSHYFKDLLNKFKRCYKVSFIVKWSLWWSFATCGFFQVGNYIQNLWATMQSPDDSNVFNGITEAVSTLLCTGIALSVQFIHLNWSLLGELTLGVITTVDALILVVISQIVNLTATYVLYVVFCVLYQLLITIATFNVASRLEPESYGLVFGWNTFIALLLQTILTFAVADEHGFALDIRSQFMVYGAYHAVIAAVFLLMGGVTLNRTGLRNCCNLAVPQQNNNTELPKDAELPVQTDLISPTGAEIFTTRS